MTTQKQRARPALTARTVITWGVPLLVVLAVVAVLLARWARELPAVASFIESYPGHAELPEAAPVGIPAWLAWQHFLNFFFIVLLVRSGWLIRTTTRPRGHWTRNNTGLLRTKRPPTKVSLNHWLHFTVDFLWLANGAVFFVLLFVTGQWMRIVPTSWEVIPNTLSVGLQYLSLDWPMENGWVNYNSLQVLAYFVTVFIAAPLAAVSGARLSPLWPKENERLNSLYPIELARKIHFPVMIYFVLFVIMHVAMVLSTGAIRNLNHMFAARSDDSLLGLWLFLTAMALAVGAWFAVRPTLLRSVATLTGKVTR